MSDRRVTDAVAAELRAWTEAWLVECAEGGFVQLPYVVDDPTLERALALHDAGLQPAEAAIAMFGVLH